MNREHFFKGQSSLHRRIIAGGLSATFCSGMCCGNYAGAMLDHGNNLGLLENDEETMKEKGQYKNLCEDFRNWVKKNQKRCLGRIPAKFIAYILFTDKELGFSQSWVWEFVRNINREAFLSLYVEYFLKTANCSNLDGLIKEFSNCLICKYKKYEPKDLESFRNFLPGGMGALSNANKNLIRGRSQKSGTIENFIKLVSEISTDEEERKNYIKDNFGEEALEYEGEISYFVGALKTIKNDMKVALQFEAFGKVALGVVPFIALVLIIFVPLSTVSSESKKRVNQQPEVSGDAEKNKEEKSSETAENSDAQNGVEGAATPSV